MFFCTIVKELIKGRYLVFGVAQLITSHPHRFTNIRILIHASIAPVRSPLVTRLEFMATLDTTRISVRIIPLHENGIDRMTRPGAGIRSTIDRPPTAFLGVIPQSGTNTFDQTHPARRGRPGLAGRKTFQQKIVVTNDIVNGKVVIRKLFRVKGIKVRVSRSHIERGLVGDCHVRITEQLRFIPDSVCGSPMPATRWGEDVPYVLRHHVS